MCFPPRGLSESREGGGTFSDTLSRTSHGASEGKHLVGLGSDGFRRSLLHLFHEQAVVFVPKVRELLFKLADARKSFCFVKERLQRDVAHFVE